MTGISFSLPSCIRAFTTLHFLLLQPFQKFIAKHKEGKILLDDSDADGENADISGDLIGMSCGHYVVSKYASNIR